jgi:hypothetical protein
MTRHIVLSYYDGVDYLLQHYFFCPTLKGRNRLQQLLASHIAHRTNMIAQSVTVMRSAFCCQTNENLQQRGSRYYRDKYCTTTCNTTNKQVKLNSLNPPIPLPHIPITTHPQTKENIPLPKRRAKKELIHVRHREEGSLQTVP